MSGEKSYSEEQLQGLETLLNEYENANYLPSIKSPGTMEELEQYLTINRDGLEQLTADACAEISVRLKQYSYYVQRLYNREQVRVSWTHKCLNKIIATHVGDFDKFMKHDMKVELIIKENGVAENLTKLLNHAEIRSIDLAFLAASIKDIGDAINSVKYSKIKGHSDVQYMDKRT